MLTFFGSRHNTCPHTGISFFKEDGWKFSVDLLLFVLLYKKCNQKLKLNDLFTKNSLTVQIWSIYKITHSLTQRNGWSTYKEEESALLVYISILLVYSTSPSPLVLLQNPIKVWCYFARDPNLLAEFCCEKVYSLLSEKCVKPAKSHQSKCFKNSDNHTYFVYSEYKLRFWSEDDSPLVRPAGQTAQVVVTHQKETCRI